MFSIILLSSCLEVFSFRNHIIFVQNSFDVVDYGNYHSLDQNDNFYIWNPIGHNPGDENKCAQKHPRLIEQFGNQLVNTMWKNYSWDFRHKAVDKDVLREPVIEGKINDKIIFVILKTKTNLKTLLFVSYGIICPMSQIWVEIFVPYWPK